MIARRWSFVRLLTALVCVVAPAAHAQTFSNTAVISFPRDNFDGRANLYPSTISVSGAPASIGSLSVTLRGFSHTWTTDVNVLLVSPGGQKIVLMANTNGSGDAVNDTLTFIPDGAALLPSGPAEVISGIYGCSVYSPQTFLGPAPPGPYEASLAPLRGTNANGTWSLYVWDDTPSADNGSFAGGWSIGFSASAPGPVPTAFTYQGVLSGSGVPISGNVNARFTLCSTATADTSVSAVALPIDRSFTGVVDGRITTTLDFGVAVDVDQTRWLNIEIESPPGSGFVTLSPRQAITPAPQARLAVNATLAATATQLAAGRQRIRGEEGAANGSPGIWFASPITAPVDRAFVGQRDDVNVGFFNAGWNLLLNANGNTVLGDGSGVAPPERLTVNGSVQVNTPNRLTFGPVGNFTSAAENTDAIFFQRGSLGSDASVLRLNLGDNSSGGAPTDLFAITTSPDGVNFFERYRFQSDGNAFKPGGGSWSNLSDASTKDNVKPMNGTLDRLLSLHGYSFTYKPEFVADGRALPGQQIGLVAQDVQKVFPEWVGTGADGKLFVTERATTALMVEALRDLRAEKDAAAAAAQRQIDALRADAASRDAENADLKARIERLERLLGNPASAKP